MEKKRDDGIHEHYEKQEVIDICLNCPLSRCKPETCQRLIKERKKLIFKVVSTKNPDYEI